MKPFTHDYYKKCIEFARGRGFSMHTMHDFLEKNPRDNFIVMRHDVDLSLKHALEMARLEHSLGIKATYFVRTSGKYSITGKELRSIAAMGHEIGLHFDSDIAQKGFKPEMLKQKELLEKASGTRIFGAALHKLKKFGCDEIGDLHFMEPYLGELGLEYDAYSDAFLKKMKYISDSSRHWVEGDMLEHMGKETRLCILTHPIWWSSRTASLVTIIEEL